MSSVTLCKCCVSRKACVRVLQSLCQRLFYTPFVKGGEDSVVRQYESEEERCGCVHTYDEVLGAVEIRDAEPEPQSEPGSSGAGVGAGAT